MKNNTLINLIKITSCALALLIVATGLSFAPAAKAVGGTVLMPMLRIGSQSAENGANISVPLNASDLVDVEGMTFNIQYDDALLTYTGYTQNALSGRGTLAINPVGNQIMINWFDSSPLIVINSSALLTLNFTVISADVTNTNLIFTGAREINDSTGTPMTVNFIDGIISLNPAPVLNSISITTPANKLSYTVGDALDITGLVVTGTYSDASTQVETITIANVTGFDSSSAVIGQVLTITVGGQTTTYTIDVVAPLPTPDLTPPVITLTGDAVVNLTVGDTYNDAGATALDDKDGDITANIVKTGLPISTAAPGAYTITYNVQDAAGNIAEMVSRTVNVVLGKVPHKKGVDNALISLDTYTDYQCPHCIQFHSILNQALEEYQGEVNFYINHFPLGFHSNAWKAAEATECANDQGEEHFWQMNDWLVSKATDFTVDDIKSFAATFSGFNLQQFNSCLDSDSKHQVIQEHINSGSDISGVPTTYVRRNSDGQFEKVEGSVSYEELKQVIDSLMSEPEPTPEPEPEPEPTPDVTAPVITLNGAPEITLTVGETYTELGATALDDVDGAIIAIITGSVDTAVIGDYIITYTVTDAANNTATITRTVHVIAAPPVPDTTAPVITLLGNAAVNLTVGDVYTDAGATASDDIDGNITANIVTVNPVNAAVVGTYTITYNVSDAAGNAATQVIRTVIVSAAVIPPAPAPVSSGGGGGGTGFIFLSGPPSTISTGPTFPTSSVVVEAVKSVVSTIVNVAPVQAVLGEKVYNYANGTLIRGSDHKVYVVENDKLHHILNLKELAKYIGKEILKVSDDTITAYGG